MKKIVFLLLVLTGCVTTTYLPDNINSEIPQGVNTIKVESALKPDSLFEQMVVILIKDGFRVTENKARLTISTEGKQLMQETLGRFTINIEKISSGGSFAIIRPEWSVTESVAAGANAFATSFSGITTSARPGWEIASWSRGRPNVVYSYGMKFARNFGKVQCYKQQQ